MTEIEQRQPEAVRGIQRREVPFPKDLEARMEAILKAFNASPKATLMLLTHESPVPYPLLVSSLRGSVDGSVFAEKVDIANTVRSYCDSLMKEGLVTTTVQIDASRKGKIVDVANTQDGETYGKTSAAFILTFERTNRFSLYPVLGKTEKSGGKHAAPITRAKILELLAKGNKREVDIQQELGISAKVTGDSLRALARAGAIEYTSVNPFTGEVQISFIPNENFPPHQVRTVVKERELTKEIVHVCQKLAIDGIPITREIVQEYLSEEVKARRTERSMEHAVSTILSGLASQGFFHRGLFHGRVVQSNARLTVKGRLIVEKFITPLKEALSDGQTLARLQEEILPRVEENLEDYARASANLYYPHSLSAKKRSQAKNERAALSLVRRADATVGILAQKVADALNVNILTAKRYLKRQILQGKTTKALVKGVFHYFPTSAVSKAS